MNNEKEDKLVKHFSYKIIHYHDITNMTAR